jgi:hypothetical protein
MARCLIEQGPIKQDSDEQSAQRRSSSTAAHEMAQRFLEEHHDSVYSDRVRRTCEIESTAGESREGSSPRGHYGPKEDHHE